MTSEKAPNDDLTGVPPEGGAQKAASLGHEAPDDAMIAQAEAAILAASARRLPLRGLIEQALLRLRRPLRTKKPNRSATRGPVTEKHKSQGLAQFDTAEVNAARLNVVPSRAAPDGPAVAAAPTLSASERKSPRKLKRRAGIWTVLLFVAAALFLGLVSMSATGRVVAMPDWVARSVEERLNAQSDAVGLSLSRIELGVSANGRPRLRLVDLGVRDETGLEIGRLNAVEGSVFVWPVLSGRFEPATLELSGAQITVRRQADGAFALSFGQGVGASGDFASVLDGIDRIFADGVLSHTDVIRADALTITLEDARTGRIWQVTDGALVITQDAEHVSMAVSFDVFNQTETLAETVLEFRSAKSSSAAEFTARFKNALSADIAAQTPLLTFLGIVDAPISGELLTVVDDDGAISDLAGFLEFGAGAISPAGGAKPARFNGGRVDIDYDPERERMDFSEMSLSSDWVQGRAAGHAYLRGWAGGWPTELIGQVQLSEAEINPSELFEDTVLLGQGGADFRLRLDPFEVDIGQAYVTHEDRHIAGSGRISADRDGWSLGFDSRAEKVTPEQVVALWPEARSARVRKWIRENVSEGHFTDVAIAWRKQGDAPAHLNLSASYQDMSIRAVKDMQPIENADGRLVIEGRRLSVVADRGIVSPRDTDGRIAGVLDISGTRFVIPKMGKPRPADADPNLPIRPVPAEVDLSVSGPVTAALHLLNSKPFQVFRKSDGKMGPDMATGRATVRGRVNVQMQPKPPRGSMQYDLIADLRNVESGKIVPGHQLKLPTATMRFDGSALSLDGQGSLSGLPVSGRWELPFTDGKAASTSSVTGRFPLNFKALEVFKVGLPKGTVQGEGRGDFKIVLVKDAPPRLTLEGDLKGVGLSIAALGWSKRKNAEGQITLTADLGQVPKIDQLAVTAPGLSAAGRVNLHPEGGLDTAEFDRVKLGGWLDAQVTLTGRGAGVPVAVTVNGGTIDLRGASVGANRGRGTAQGQTPIDLRLDRLIVSEGIVLTPFEAALSSGANGLSGQFEGRVSGGPVIQGVAAPQPNGTAFRINARDAGAVMREAGLFKSAKGGTMELILTPAGGKGVYEGSLAITDNLDVHNAPAMAELLSAISVIGLLQQLGGQGIPFTDVNARFRLDPEKVTIYESSASGHSMGISMDGYYYLGTEQLQMQGVISPFYVVNSVGRIFARRGEGLVGFNYQLEGTATSPKVSVNPLSILTPGIFRDIFRRDPPPRPE
ncbi:AsmA-like C-terminal region-containing protein [Aliiroseovarius sp. S1123]|uniref:AsmA-like C-terminal region-containing protein n=1 Tax=unclassified Aliiroseovarius TaxID=2623558 RepID=UPI001FF4153D|nr:AsmA-like C-terminal region-containing protein [Aliiroseovarius sp. S1123]MCK0170160.1 AsmA-like C-terminal region-containing protein [Aliiroseovarius sp. S1123]